MRPPRCIGRQLFCRGRAIFSIFDHVRSYVNNRDRCSLGTTQVRRVARRARMTKGQHRATEREKQALTRSRLCVYFSKNKLGCFRSCEARVFGARHLSWCSSLGDVGLEGGRTNQEGVNQGSSTRLSRGHNLKTGHEGGTSHKRRTFEGC